MADDKGTVIRPAHFPDRAPIDAYGNGGFRFANMSHTGGLLCLPSGIHGWPEAGLGEAAFARALAEAEAIEILLVGTGTSLVPIPEELRRQFRRHRIMADSMSTGAAVRTYNVLLAENRAVAAALLPVD